MATFITKEKLEVFNKYAGDIDGLLRINKTIEIEIFGDSLEQDWGLISSKLQDLALISTRRASYDFTKQTLIQLTEITDEKSFQVFTDKIIFYNDFQEIKEILEQIKVRITPETDTVWAAYDNADEFLVDLNADIEKIRFCDFATLDKLVMEFAASCTYQEIALSNGWSSHYLKLAKKFDYLHDKITSRYSTTHKKLWWKFWAF